MTHVITPISSRASVRAAVTKPGEWILTTPVGELHYFLRRSWRDLPGASVAESARCWMHKRPSSGLLQAFAPETPNICAMNSALHLLGFTRELPDRIDDV